MARTVVAIYDGFQRANEAVRELIDNGFPRDNISILANNARGEYGRINTDASAVRGTEANAVRGTEAGAVRGTEAGAVRGTEASAVRGAEAGAVRGTEASAVRGAEAGAVYNSEASAARSPAADVNDEAAEDTGTGVGMGAGIGAAIGGIGGLLVGLGALAIPGIGPVVAAGPLAVALSTLTGAGVGAVAGGVTGGLLGALIGLGIPEEEAEYYTEGVRRGGVLVTVQTDDDRTEQVMDLLNHYQPVDINQRASEWREEGWNGYDPAAQTVQASPQTLSVQDSRLQNTLPQGTYPQANNPQDLRTPVTPDAAVTQPSSGSWRQADYSADFDVDSPIYLNHYRAFLADTGNPYDYYVPAYRYGYSVAADTRYQNRPWEQIEPALRRDWEMEHPGTWERFSTAIRHAWEDITDRRTGL